MKNGRVASTRTSCVVLISVLLVLVTSGCLVAALGGAAAGAGAAVYYKGKLTQTLDKPLDVVHRAAISTLRQRGLPVLEDRHDNFTAGIKSQYADGKDVRITLERSGDSNTRVTIRVGLMGDEMRAMDLLDRIKMNLIDVRRSPAL